MIGAVAGCSSVSPNRPYGNLGDSVNSASDEFAPALRPGKSSLYFTSNRRSTDDIWRSDLNSPAAAAIVASVAAIDQSDISLLSQPTTNDGAIVFTAPGTGFFAAGHAPDTLFSQGTAAFGGIIGGTDLFEFTTGTGRARVRNLGTAVNSVFWDSHPAVATRGDSVLVVFSSDRPSNGIGYSSPYGGEYAVTERGDSILGNSDLYYVFRINGQWSKVRNLVQVDGMREVNSRKNEYSPLLYCLAERPRLFFSSNRGGSYDLWEAEIDVDFSRQNLTVAKVTTLPSGIDSINTDADELFPYITEFPKDGSGQYLYFSSNRDQKSRSIGEKSVQSAGGFDLYRLPLMRECRPPQLRYEVTVIDAENPSRPVLRPVIRLYRLPNRGASASQQPASNPESEAHENKATFTLDFGTEYATFGGSEYNEINCQENVPTIESYRFVQISQGRPTVTKGTSYEWRDTMIRVRRVLTVDTTVTDTISVDDVYNAEGIPNSIIEAVTEQGDKLFITRRVRWEAVRYEGGTPSKYRARVDIYDTVASYDTLYVPTSTQLGPSERVRRHGNLNLPQTRTDLTVRDTIYVVPKYYQAPPCEWLYTRNMVDDYEKNVPYFQTAFWEVNTSSNFREHRSLLNSDKYSDGGFIELHPNNMYFGTAMGARRPVRIAQYGDFSRVVDKNLNAMASEIAEQIVPEFIDYDMKTTASNNRLVIQIAAFSDVRPIQRGYYLGSETVRYVAGGYDSTSQGLKLYDVSVQPGASLVSQSNDTLSKLRAYFGYKELIARLQKFPRWQKLVADGTILLPFPDITPNEYRSKMEKAKILVVMEGRDADRTEQPVVSGYVGQRKDFYSLDDVRRIDVQVNRLEYINGRLVKSPCCTPGPAKLSEGKP